MRVDPVVALMDELEAAHAALTQARNAKDWRSTRCELARIASLQASLHETEPAGVIGASHLLREAACTLNRSNAPYYGDRLCEVANRLGEGRRLFSDLVWLRSAREALASGQCGRTGKSAAQLVALALKGASRPVLLYRAITPSWPKDETSLRSETNG